MTKKEIATYDLSYQMIILTLIEKPTLKSKMIQQNCKQKWKYVLEITKVIEKERTKEWKKEKLYIFCKF